MTTSAEAQRLPTVFISHGGGPWPWMPQAAPAYALLAQELRHLPERWGAPIKAILMVSAHWEEPVFTVQGASQPGMLYDYHGFAAETYQIHYRSSGSPALAQRVQGLLQAAGMAVRNDPVRGYDHGMYAPMQVMYPNADVPVVQLSLRQGLDPEEHLALGRVLAPLRDEGVLLMGSGLSYHNLRHFGPSAQEVSVLFDGWLADAMLQHTGSARSALLRHWEQAPAARQAHPREEHLLPLMVVVGAAEAEHAVRSYHETGFMGGVSVSNFVLGAIGT